MEHAINAKVDPANRAETIRVAVTEILLADLQAFTEGRMNYAAIQTHLACALKYGREKSGKGAQRGSEQRERDVAQLSVA